MTDGRASGYSAPMQKATQGLYWLVAAIGLTGGLIAVFAPWAVLGEAANGTLAGHLAREQGAGFVFIGLVAAWCARHEASRVPAHYAFLIFTALLAIIHWWGYLSSGGYFGAAVVNTLPFAAFAATLPRAATS